MTSPGPPSGLIDFFLHPPIGALSFALDEAGPYTGRRTLTTWSQGPGPIFTSRPVSQSFGVQLQLNGPIPTSWGFTNGWVSDDGQYDESRYTPPLAQLVAQHQLLTGQWVTTNFEIIESFPHTVFWDVAFPGRIGLLIAPHLSFDLFYAYLV